MTALTPTDEIMSEAALRECICWDDNEDKDAALAPGVYRTCAGAWMREPDGRWRWHRDEGISL